MSRVMIESVEDVENAIKAIESAYQLVGLFDWQQFNQLLEVFETAGADLNPTAFEAMKQDRQWDQKKRVFQATLTFVNALDEIARELER